ncbi:tripartite tricarboxylate transporter substrate binding protein [Aquincola sp. MAHUQ-54]|uniref:Tripartite tricarboxylate transporter substrate binding protein n=1 Tax=Aquincola agrisoli TaxID=3119538 RepID=A0AAW9QGI5_9BURK
MKRRHLIAVAAAFAAPALALAQNGWPNKQPVRLIVPASPGGSLDALTRPLAAQLTTLLGQQVIVENRGGAGGVLGADVTAKSAPDGYTFLLAATHHAIAPGVYPKMPYDSTHDLVGVAHIGNVPNMVVVNEKLPVKTLPEFVAWAKANPDKVNYATGGAGTLIHIASEMFASQARITMVPVHYRGSAPGITDLVGGNVQVMFETLPSAAVQVRGGKLRALAVTSPKRNPAFPEVPTVAESGYPGFDAITWYGVMAPARTPPEAIKAMNAAVNTALQSPEIKKAWQTLGVEATPMSAEAFQAFWLQEITRWTGIAKAQGVKVE